MEDKQDLFDTCPVCPVRDWCKLRSGEVKLPPSAPMSFCVGYAKLSRALELSNLPIEYHNANLHNYVRDGDNQQFSKVVTELLAKSVGFVSSGTNIAFINKGKGTGKTWTAAAVVNEFIYKTCRDPKWFDMENPVALYVKFGTWANRQRDVITRRDDDFTLMVSQELNDMKDVPLLVLDDIGSGRITDYIRDLTYDIIDYRKENQKSTIFTSNFSDEILNQDNMLGDMIVSRMLYNTMVIPLGGRDRRKDNMYNY